MSSTWWSRSARVVCSRSTCTLRSSRPVGRTGRQPSRVPRPAADDRAHDCSNGGIHAERRIVPAGCRRRRRRLRWPPPSTASMRCTAARQARVLGLRPDSRPQLRSNQRIQRGAIGQERAVRPPACSVRDAPSPRDRSLRRGCRNSRRPGRSRQAAGSVLSARHGSTRARATPPSARRHARARAAASPSPARLAPAPRGSSAVVAAPPAPGRGMSRRTRPASSGDQAREDVHAGRLARRRSRRPDTITGVELREQLAGAVVMAPMTKGSNLPYRRLCVELGARVHDERDDRRAPAEAEAAWRVRADPAVRPTSRSSACSSPARIRRRWAGRPALVESRGADLVDVNLGCPIDHFTRKGIGAALGRQPRRIRRIVEAMKGVGAACAVTVKIRLGWNDDDAQLSRRAGRGRRRAPTRSSSTAARATRATAIAADWDASARSPPPCRCRSSAMATSCSRTRSRPRSRAPAAPA